MEEQLRQIKAELAAERAKSNVPSGAQTPGQVSGPMPGAADFASLLKQNQEMNAHMQQRQNEQHEKVMEKAFGGLATVMEQLVAEKSKPIEKDLPSCIRFESPLQWPTLGDDGPGGQEVKDFYKKFEQNCKVASSGRGLQPR